MDHSARQSMKNAASCDNQCELQDTTSIRILNAHCGLRFLDVATSVRGSLLISTIHLGSRPRSIPLEGFSSQGLLLAVTPSFPVQSLAAVYFPKSRGFASRSSRSGRHSQVCDALRCSGPHARYTEEVNERFFPVPIGLGNLLKPFRARDRGL